MRGDAASATMALHSQGSPTDVLGVNIAAPEEYAPSILVPIPRAKGRGLLGLAEGNLLPFAGDDVWNCYELSWLNASGVPRRQTLELTIPCTTPFIVESKSLKLYLNSLNFKRFASPAAVVETITVDVGRVLGAPLRVALRDDTVEPPLLDAWRGPRPGAGLGLSWACIDGEDVGDLPAEHLDKPDPTHLRPVAFATGSGAVVVERIVTHLLRTRCPVTGQPDWGSLLIEYHGAPIDRAALLRYVVSLRREIGFHENAVERIALAIHERCQCQALRVTGRFFRRGGIDINPVRTMGAEDIDAAIGTAPPQLRVPGQ